jgi:hypothetical protein
MITTEPDLLQGESAVQAAIVAEAKHALAGTCYPSLVIEQFGLDVAVWVGVPPLVLHKFLELKVFRSGRPGAVGFGRSVRWIVADGTLPRGSPRYSIATSVFAKRAATGGVSPDKQDNLRMSDFAPHLIPWPALLAELSQFLLQ